MLRLLLLISWPQLRQSWGRTLLVVGGISTGVSLIVAINVINASVLQNFRKTIEMLAGPAALEVTLGVGEVGFAEETVDLVRADPDVVAAVPLVRGTIAVADAADGVLDLFGADLTAEEDLHRYHVTTADRKELLRGLADPRSILVTTRFARERALEVGDVVELVTPRGVQGFTVRGLLETEGLAALLGGQLAVMDLPAAQMLLGKDGRVDQVDLVLREDADVAKVKMRLEQILPRSLTVTRPVGRAIQYERIISSFQAMLTGLSLLCLVVGFYIIYNTTSTGAVHRALVMASVRLIGAEPQQLFRMVMLEAAALGTLGALAGIATGLVLARLLIGMVAESMGVIFQLRFPLAGFALRPGELVLIGIVGVTTALAASYAAARRVALLEPLEVMRVDARSVPSPVRTRQLVTWWAVLVLISIVALSIEVRIKSIVWGSFGSTLWNASVLVIAVPLVTWSSRGLSGALRRVFGAPGRVAAESLFRSTARTGVTVAAVAAMLAIAITVATLARSHRESVSDYVRGFLASDLIVSAVTTDGGWLETPLPDTLGAEIAGIDGVRETDLIRVLPGQMFRGERIAVAAFNSTFFRPDRWPESWYRAGDPRSAAESLREGRGANVSVNLADRFDLRVGDTIELDTPTGPVALPIVGIVPDYISDRGTVIINRETLIEHWHDHMVNRINVAVGQDATVDTVREAIARTVGSRYRVKILSLGEGVSYLADKIDRAFAFTDAIQLLVVIVTVAGIFDLLLAAIWERRRELALWRVIGADERAVRASVVIESATIGILGVVLGLAAGLSTAWIWVKINYRYLLGYDLDFHLPLAVTVWNVTLVLAMTILAGYAAARHATGQSVVDAMHAE